MELCISDEIYEKVRQTYGIYFSGISGIASEKLTVDALSLKKPDEQIALLKKFYPSVRGMKLLEVGSGFGNFLVVARKKYDIDAYGVEPSSDGFDDSFAISKKILSDNGVNPGIIINGKGEVLPFPNSSFDICYSSNVLEHVDDPQKLLQKWFASPSLEELFKLWSPTTVHSLRGIMLCFICHISRNGFGSYGSRLFRSVTQPLLIPFTLT